MSKGLRFAVSVAVVLLVVGLLSPMAQAKVKIRWWGIHGGSIGRAQRSLADRYMKENPDIELELKEGVLGLTDAAAFLTAIAGGKAPEMTFWDGFTVGEFAARGVIMPLDDLAATSKHIRREDFVEYAWLEGTFPPGKTLYGVRFDCSTHGLGWNKRLYSEVGLDPDKPPKTWDEYAEYGKKLTKYDAAGNIVDRIGEENIFDPTILLTMAFQQGADWVSEDGRTVTINGPAWVKALEKMVDFTDRLGGRQKIDDFGKVTEVMAGLTLFSAEKSAQHFRAGLWILGPMEKYARHVADNIGVTNSPLIEPGAKPMSFMGGWANWIPKGTKPELAREAFKFIDWMERPDIKLDYCIEASKLPITWPGLDAVRKEAESESPRMFAPHIWLKFIDLAKIGFGRTATPFSFLMWQELARAIDDATYHKMTPKEALDKAAARVQKEFDKFYKK
ncbi:MAG: extracellular solute-binding protein [bacterium]